VAPFALRGTPVYLYFSSLPIDLQVVVFEPGIAEDYALLSKARDSKKCSLEVGLVKKDYIYYFRDLTCFIGRAVYMIHWYEIRDAPGADTLCIDKVFIYEAAHSSRVQKCFERMHLASVSGIDPNRKDDRRSAGIESITNSHLCKGTPYTCLDHTVGFA